MKTKLLRLILILLGCSSTLSSCFMAAYGSPSADFTLKGKVIDAETGAR